MQKVKKPNTENDGQILTDTDWSQIIGQRIVSVRDDCQDGCNFIVILFESGDKFKLSIEDDYGSLLKQIF